MYKSVTAEDFRRQFNLPTDYKVRGMLSYGAWDEDKHFKKIVDISEELKILQTSRRLDGFLSRIVELTIENSIYWFTVMYGGAMLSECVHLASLLGSERNIHFGSCGGLYPEMNSLDLLIPTWSFGDESTTRAYARDHRHYPDKTLSAFIRSKIPNKYKVWNGPAITYQAMMGETWDDVKSWSENGYYGVEMETATVFSVSKHFDVPSASLLYVTDNLIKGQVVGDDSHNQQKEIREEVKNDVYKVVIQSLTQK